MYPPNADCEKTQVPEPQELRELRRRQRDLDNCCGMGASPVMSSEQVLAELFRYHPPTDDQLPKYAAINQAAKNFAEVILQNCPASADRSAAIRLIRDARMTANAAIALNGLSL